MVDVAFFLEEPSAREFLIGFVEKNFSEINPIFVVFEGKQDLDRRLAGKLKAWLPPRPRFVVVRDQDSGDCAEIKKTLLRICQNTGHPQTLVCVVCHELESWFLGDLAAVSQAYDMPALASDRMKRKFRDPDELNNAKQELRSPSQGKYQPMHGSREMGKLISPERNSSRSFAYFNQKLKFLVGSI